METSNGFKFYNAGERIEELWPFSISPSSAGFNPGEAGTDTHSIGKWPFIAPKRGWFFVPQELQSGVEIVRVNFPEDAKRKYGKRGVVMLDPRHDPAKEDANKPLQNFPLAPTEELVVARAETLWDEFLEGVCSSHFDDVQNAMAQGNRPRAASGFTVHALKLKGYRDPAAEFLQGLKEGKNGSGPQNGSSPEMLGILKGIQEQNKLMTSLILAVASGQKLDPELLKALIKPEDGNGHEPRPSKPAASTEVPENAGHVEVEGVSPVGVEARIHNRQDGWEKAKPTHLGKGKRAEAAEKEL